jgi:MoaA/NifB/PqqE/SkfB family radical SAM enzyme
MSVELFEKILQEFENNNYIPRVAVLYHGGEPLLNKNIFNFSMQLRSVMDKARGGKVKIVTNGSLLTDDVVAKLIESGINEVEVSFDGFSPEENNRIRKNGDFYRDAQKVINLAQLGKHITVAVSNARICSRDELMSYQRGAKLTPPKYLRQFFASCGSVKITSFPAVVWPGYDGGEYETLTLRPESPHAPCSQACETITVCSDGSDVPCCYDIVGLHILGNAHDQSLMEIWNSPHSIAFRNVTATNRPPALCSSCVRFTGRYLMKICSLSR